MESTTPFISNLQCETSLPWKELIDQLEYGMKRFSKGEIEQPVRVMLPVEQHKGFLGKNCAKILQFILHILFKILVFF
jgi:hypothetical protein